MGGDGGCRVGEVQAGTTSSMPNHKGFKLTVTVRDPLTPFLSDFQKFNTLRVKYLSLFSGSYLLLCIGTPFSSLFHFFAEKYSPHHTNMQSDFGH